MFTNSTRPLRKQTLILVILLAAFSTACLPSSPLARTVAGCPTGANYDLCARSVAGARTPAAAEAIKFAMSQVGSPYCSGCGNRFGRGSVPKYDCSGLVVRSYQEAGVDLGAATSRTLIASGGPRRAVRTSEARPGDIVGRRGRHVALLLADGKIVEAVQSGTPSRVSDLEGRRLTTVVAIG